VFGETVETGTDVPRQLIGLGGFADQQRERFVAHAGLDLVNPIDRPQVDRIDRQAIEGVGGQTNHFPAPQAGGYVLDSLGFRLIRMNSKDFRRQDFSTETELRLQHPARNLIMPTAYYGRCSRIAPMPPASRHIHSRIVQSRQNSRVKELRASFSPGGRSQTGRVGIEGEHLLVEAVRSGIEIATVFFRSGDEAILDRITLDTAVEVIELPPEVFASAVATESPQGVAALVAPKAFSLDDVLRMDQLDQPLIVIAAGLQDPGNLGTLIRSAEAFGASGVVTLPGTVSPWNAKALRASSGSAFRLPIVAANEEEIFPRLRSSGIRVLAAVADRGLPAAEVDLTGSAVLLIGNEGRGLPESLLKRADGRVSIPYPGPVESLNAAIAGSILLYEASRQRG